MKPFVLLVVQIFLGGVCELPKWNIANLALHGFHFPKSKD